MDKSSHVRRRRGLGRGSDERLPRQRRRPPRLSVRKPMAGTLVPTVIVNYVVLGADVVLTALLGGIVGAIVALAECVGETDQR